MTKPTSGTAKANARTAATVSTSDRSLFVTNLPLTCNAQELREFFSQFGPVSPSTRVKLGAGFGFVDFESAADAASVLAQHKTLSFWGNEIRLDRCTTKAERKAKQPPEAQPAKQQQQQHSVYLGKIPRQISETDILALLPPNMTLTSSLRLHDSTNVLDANQIRFGFLDFATNEEAEEAIKLLQSTELVRANRIKVAMAHPNTTPGAAEKRAGDQPVVTERAESVRIFRRSVAFPNLPEGISVEDLYVVLQVFGKIKRVQLSARGLDTVPAARSRVEVEFDTTEGARAAHAELIMDGFGEDTEFDGDRFIALHLNSHPTLPEVLEMFSAVASVRGANISPISTSAEVEFEEERTAKLVLQYEGPILLRAQRIYPQLASTDAITLKQ